MSTRAPAPRCASCGMPLAPGATSCAVCGARVPLIARSDADAGGATTPPAPRHAAGRAEAPAPTGAPAGDASPTGSVAAPGPVDDGAWAPSWAPSADAPTPGPDPRPAPTPASVDLPPAPQVRAAGAEGPVAPARRPDAAGAARAVRAAGRPSYGGPADGGAPSVGRRVGAYAIDLALAFAVGAVGVLVGTATGIDVTVLAGALGAVVGLGQVVAEGLRGATLGAHLLGLRTVDDRTGAAPGVPRAFLRQLVVALGTPVCLVGNWVVVASATWDRGPAGRGWHDKASGTRVVRADARPSTAPRTAAPRSSSVGPAPGPVPVPSADAMYAPPPPQDVRGQVPPPPVGPVPPRPPSAAPDLVADAPAAPVAPVARAHREADLLPPPPVVAGVDVAPVARRTVPEAPAVDPSDEDVAELEHTRVRHPDSLRRRTGTLALSFDTGERVRVVGRGLVGRGPRAEDGEDILHVVALQDAARSLSRVHAEFGPQEATPGEGAAIWVTDRGSTNGTVVVDPDGVARVLPSGTPAVVRAGWTVRLGDREARVEDD